MTVLWLVLTFVSLIVTTLAVVYVVWQLPRRQVAVLRSRLTSLTAKDANSKDRIELELDLLAAETSARATLAQIIGGVLVLLGLATTGVNLKVTYDSAKASTEVSEHAQIAERFAKGVPQIAENDIVIRLGGIQALANVARESKEQHWSAMSVLTAFVRGRSLISGGVDCQSGENDEKHIKMKCEDIQAALMTIATRNAEHDPEGAILDLRSVYA